MSNPPTPREVRLFCDGELSAQEAAAVEAKLREHAGAGALADFERDLKKRVATVMTEGSSPPAGLAEQVRAALAAEPVPHRVPDEPRRAAKTRPATNTGTETQHRAWWRAPLRANAFAVAASLILVAGAVLFGIFGQPIDTWRNRSLLDIGSEAAAAVAEEHLSVAGGPIDPGPYSTPETAEVGLAPYLGEGGCVSDLTDLGYTFVCGDTCERPPCDHGCHLIYKHTGREAYVTLHVVPDLSGFTARSVTGLDGFPLPTGKFPRGSNCRMDVLVWSYGGRSYLLCTCIPEDCEKVALRIQQRLLDADR